MAFSETVKKEVKEKTAFRCCRCQSISVQVHHIVPEGEGGPDTIENAAPLCPSCHDYFGANPTKRKEIKHMRDWWYQKVEQMYPNKYVTIEQIGEISSRLEEIQRGQNSGLSDLKKAMKLVTDRMIDGISTETADATASGIINTSAAVSAVTLGDKVHANVRFNNCGTQVGLLIGSNACPNCGASIS